jgi:hypothetical protein
MQRLHGLRCDALIGSATAIRPASVLPRREIHHRVALRRSARTSPVRQRCDQSHGPPSAPHCRMPRRLLARLPAHHALAGHRLEVCHLCRLHAALTSDSAMMASASGCSEPLLQPGCQRQHGISPGPAQHDMPDSTGLPSVSVPVLSTTRTSVFAQPSPAPRPP